MTVETLVFGIIVGLAAGLSPGPLIALVVSEALKHGTKKGVQVAVSPLISETPIILFALMLLSSAAGNSVFLAIISLLGASFLTYLGLKNLRFNVKESGNDLQKNSALLRGITTNLLNPSTYIFWLTVGGPKILENVQVHTSVAILFLIGFYTMLIGSMTAVAIAVAKSRTLVKNKYYVHIIRALGIVLVVFALIFVGNFLQFVGIL